MYAVLDEGGLIDEIHEGNNTGFNVLGWSVAPVGVDEAAWPTQAAPLLHVYPNPFPSTATINYTLQEAGRTTITIHDQLGRMVATVADGHLPAGEHRATFDGSALPDGLYLCVLRSGMHSGTHRIVVAH